MFGYQGSLLEIRGGIIKNIHAGHVAMYIGREEGIDYVVEASGSGIVKTPAKYFVNRADGETFLGARLPAGLSPLRQAKAVAIAKSLVGQNLAYDFGFQRQKGARSGQWTCVGLTEKIYESADISNPNNLAALEYDSTYYAIDITPDGFDDYSPANDDGDRFSREREFSEIARRRDLLFPAPELVGFDAGVERDGKRYIFMPYTQFIQPTLTPVAADITVASSFSSPEVRGDMDWLSIGLRWSLINNPWSSIKNLANKAGELVGRLGDKLFGSETATEIVLNDDGGKNESDPSVLPAAIINKNNAGVTASSPKVLPSPLAATDLPATSGVTVNSKKTSVAGPARAASSSSSAPSGVSSPAVTVLYNPTATTTSSAILSAAIISNPAAQASDDAPRLARINQIYATGDNDWIELYNPTDYDFDLATAGYRLERTKSAEDPGLVMRFGNPADGSYPGGTIIKSKGRYLIVRSDAGPYYHGRAKAIGTRSEFSWGGSGYTIYLGNGAISSSADEDIVEAVGFGPEAAYFQGSAPALEIRDNYILSRIAVNHDNASDFKLVAADDPTIIWNQVEEEENEENVDNGASGEEEPEEEAPLATTTPPILIGKIYATGSNDWIELTNPTAQAIDLAVYGYRLEKTKTAEDPSLMMRIGNEADGAYPGGTVVSSGGRYLIVRDDAADFYKSRADALATRDEFVWSGRDYTIYLAKGPVSSSTDPDIMDAVGFGEGASFFAGAGPALEINDGYILNRIGQSGNNSTDFNLIPTDEPGSEIDPIQPVDERYTPIESAGLINLWHFDECYGPGQWEVGKWECARELGHNKDIVSVPLLPPADLDSFSIGFQYKKKGQFPRLRLKMTSPDASPVLLILEENLFTVEGLPNSQWRYYQEVRFDDDWHQVVLTIDQAADYWAVYLDGAEIIREEFMANLPVMSTLELSGDSDSTLIDEVAVWHRPLSGSEILSDYILDSPFAPIVARLPQLAAELEYFWEFEEDSGAVAVDSRHGTQMDVYPNLWTARRHDNYAISTGLNQTLSADLDLPLSSRDVSIAFWWRNSAHPDEGQANIVLSGSEPEAKKLLTLNANHYRLGYHFNGQYGILAEGMDVGLPPDGEWHHVALVYDSYRYRLSLYVDGEEAAWASFIWMQETEIIKRLEIATNFFTAALDDLRIYKGALSQEQVGEIFANTK